MYLVPLKNSSYYLLKKTKRCITVTRRDFKFPLKMSGSATEGSGNLRRLTGTPRRIIVSMLGRDYSEHVRQRLNCRINLNYVWHDPFWLLAYWFGIRPLYYCIGFCRTNNIRWERAVHILRHSRPTSILIPLLFNLTWNYFPAVIPRI